MTNNLTLNEDKDTLLTDSFSKVVFLSGESSKELNKIKDKIVKDLNPVGGIEEILTSKIIADCWKLRRLYILENNIFKTQQKGFKDRSDPYILHAITAPKQKRHRSTVKQIKHSKELESIQRHMNSVEVTLMKSITEFKEIQKLRLKASQ